MGNRSKSKNKMPSEPSGGIDVPRSQWYSNRKIGNRKGLNRRYKATPADIKRKQSFRKQV